MQSTLSRRHRDVRAALRSNETRPYLGEWFRLYRLNFGLTDYFESYRRFLERGVSGSHRNFLLGSGLLRHHEVAWCRVLRWLLDPKSCGELAAEFQRAVLRDLVYCRPIPKGPLRAEREVKSDDEASRFDIILSGASVAVRIEAKVNAPVGSPQFEKYEEHDFDSNLLITKYTLGSGRTPKGWQHATWSDVAEFLNNHLHDNTNSDDLDPDKERWCMVARDFVGFIREFGGNP